MNDELLCALIEPGSASSDGSVEKDGEYKRRESVVRRFERDGKRVRLIVLLVLSACSSTQPMLAEDLLIDESEMVSV